MSLKQYEIRRLDQMRAMVSPVRSRILRALAAGGPLSVREIAAFIGREPETIYYHVRGLMKVDLVRVQSKRSIGPRSESVYDVVNRSIRVTRADRSEAFLRLMHKALRSCLRLAERQFESALSSKTYTKGPRSRELHFQQVAVRLSAKDLREFLRRNDDAIAFAVDHHDPDRGRWITVTTVITPGSESSA